jgi:hypothetical protein
MAAEAGQKEALGAGWSLRTRPLLTQTDTGKAGQERGAFFGESSTEALMNAPRR